MNITKNSETVYDIDAVIRKALGVVKSNETVAILVSMLETNEEKLRKEGMMEVIRICKFLPKGDRSSNDEHGWKIFYSSSADRLTMLIVSTISKKQSNWENYIKTKLGNISEFGYEVRKQTGERGSIIYIYITYSVQ
ncbi:MAG: hypothetical protein WCX74_00810 [Candidatus Paceibacterota bacterium]